MEDLTNCFSVMTMVQLANRHPDVPWREYINRLVCPCGRMCMLDHHRVMVNVPGYLTGLITALRATSNRVMANYMVWRAVASCVAFTDRRLRDRQQVLHEELFGRPAREPRWTECVDVTASGLYLAVGSMYVTRYFHKNAKKAAVDMVESIRKEMYSTLLNTGMRSVTARRTV